MEFNGLVPGHVFGKFDYAETEPVVRGLPRLPHSHQIAHDAHQEYSVWRYDTPGFPYKRDTSSQAKSQKPTYSIPAEAQQSGFRYQSDSARGEYKDISNKNFRQSDFQKLEETFVNYFPTFDSFWWSFSRSIINLWNSSRYRKIEFILHKMMELVICEGIVQIKLLQQKAKEMIEKVFRLKS